MKNLAVQIPPKRSRKYLPHQLNMNSWADLQPYFDDLLKRPLNSGEDLHNWVLDQDEIGFVIGEEARWRMIKATCDTTNEDLQASYAAFLTNIQPKLSKIYQELGQKLINCSFLPSLDQQVYFTYLRSLENKLRLFRSENVPLFTKESLKRKDFGKIAGGITVKYQEKELTLQQASKLLSDPDRAVRKKAYDLITDARYAYRNQLDELYEALHTYRHQIAVNAGFSSYRDYRFEQLGRFDYSPVDCFEFHHAIVDEILPFIRKIQQQHQKALGFENLRPYDMEIDPYGAEALKPFDDTQELVAKTIECLSELNPTFGEYISIMSNMGHLDLDSRKGKAPGGFNCLLPETGVPFIFMNAVGSIRDLVTMVHEAGHAMHSFLTRPLPLTWFQSTPSEVAELASMSMELISMEHWHVFFDNKEVLRRAKIRQLEKTLGSLPMIAKIDKFQHWLYTNPNHTREERQTQWEKLSAEFSVGLIDISGYEHYFSMDWQRVLHIYEVPFYYIEYAIAQLGAIAMWRQYKQNPEQALSNYIDALKLGYTRPIGEIYETAGISFDFSKKYVKELGEFLMAELEQLY